MKSRCLLILLAGILSSSLLYGGHKPVSREAPPSKLFIDLLLRASYNADSSSATIPFSRAGNLILLQAKADTTEGNFVLDTGCPSLVLNITYFRDYPVTASGEERNGITAASFVAEQTEVAEFAFGGFRYYKLGADLANLGNIENSKGVKILGLLGVELFRQFEMIIDFDKNIIHLQRLSRKGTSFFQHPALADTGSYTIVPFDITDNRIMLSTVLAGKKIKLILDSGAETNLLDSRLPEKIFDQVLFTGRTTLTGAGNKKIEVMKGNLRSLMIGTRELEALPVLVTNLERTCFSYAGCVDGILGFDFLSLNRVGFNFVTKKLYIWK